MIIPMVLRQLLRINIQIVVVVVIIGIMMMRVCSSSSSSSNAPSRILFGSCNSQNLTQPLWPVIMSRNGTAFVWGGDAIYADYTKGIDLSNFPSVKTYVHSATPETFDLFYAQQLKNQAYRSFINTGIPIFGTLDDHDYGINNGDMNFPYAKESALAFLNFSNEPKDSPMWIRAKQGLGLYGVKVFDFDRPIKTRLLSNIEAGLDPDVVAIHTANFSAPSLTNKKVAVFVLDIRTNRSPWKQGVVADYEGDFLGDRQWEWFEEALRRSDAAANIVVQGLPVHAHRHYDNSIAEDWEKFPASRQRLYDTLLQEGVEAPILVSGDVHMAHLMRQDCFKEGNKIMQRSLIEFTTSGMTHSWGNCFSPQMKAQKSLFTPLARFTSWSFMTLSHALYDFTEIMFSNGATSEFSIDETNDMKYPLFGNGGGEKAKSGLQFSLDLNFGELEFDWHRRVVNFRIHGKDMYAPPLLSANWTLDELSGRNLMPEAKARSYYLNNSRFWQNSLHHDSEWQCLPHRGWPNRIQWLFAQVVVFIYFSIIILSIVFGPLLAAVFCLIIAAKYFGLKRFMPAMLSLKSKTD